MHTENVGKEELIERATLLFKHQKEQYDAATDGLRKLEDKVMKTFSALSIIITISLLVVRFWWIDIFPNKYTPLHAFCWLFLFVVVITFMISWGFAFSAVTLKDFKKPSSNKESMESFYMKNERFSSLSSYAGRYSDLTKNIHNIHHEKVNYINKCFESMLYGAWAFVIFLITVVIIKLS